MKVILIVVLWFRFCKSKDVIPILSSKIGNACIWGIKQLAICESSHSGLCNCHITKFLGNLPHKLFSFIFFINYFQCVAFSSMFTFSWCVFQLVSAWAQKFSASALLCMCFILLENDLKTQFEWNNFFAHNSWNSCHKNYFMSNLWLCSLPSIYMPVLFINAYKVFAASS